MSGRILVTGSGGFVGTYLLAALATRWPNAQIVGMGQNAERAVDLCDHTSVDAIVADVRPQVIVHLAAQASVGALGHGAEDETWRVNLGATLNLALAVARVAPAATFLFASSSEVYGRAFGPRAVNESDVPLPVNAYAKSKLLAEQVLADVLPTTARLIVARPFNHTGAGQREDFVLPSFAGQVARIEAGLQAPEMRVGNLDAARDFLHVHDVVDAYCQLIAAASEMGPRTIYNVASGTALPLRVLLDQLHAASRVPFEITVDPARLRASDIPVACGDASRLRTMTGWSPKVSVECILRDLLDGARQTLQK